MDMRQTVIQFLKSTVRVYVNLIPVTPSRVGYYCMDFLPSRTQLTKPTMKKMPITKKITKTPPVINCLLFFGINYNSHSSLLLAYPDLKKSIYIHTDAFL